MNGAGLKTLREANNWSLDQAADVMGLEPHVLSGLEKGHRQLTKRQWFIVEKVLRDTMKTVAAVKAAVTSSQVPQSTERDL